MHKLDWDEVEYRKEGGGKIIEVRKESTLLSGEQQRRESKKEI